MYYTQEYIDYQQFLEKEAKRLNCKPSEIELNDDDFNYDAVKW